MKNKFLHHSPGEIFTPNPFLPVIDDFIPDGIFSMDPLDLIEQSKFNDVPLILGTNQDEGLAFLPLFLPRNPEEYIKRHINSQIPQLLLGK